MMLGSFYFKNKAKQALSGNWQTALLVVFFAGVLGTVLQVAQLLMLPNQAEYLSVETYLQAAMEVPQSTWNGLLALSLVTLLVSPALSLGRVHYFVERVRGNELGFQGLLSRMRYFGKALWLSLCMAVRIFLWSLLLIVPGIIAAIRYSMAPYYLAENPDISAGEAINRSKNAMANMKMSYFSLSLSFLGWTLAATLLQTLLVDVNYVLGTVAGLFAQVWVTTYMEAACAVFFLTVSQEKGIEKAHREMFSQFEQMGMDPDTLDEMKTRAGMQEDAREKMSKDLEDMYYQAYNSSYDDDDDKLD